jgi:uncharacterized membrane protein YidH (DUF202 family)
MTRFDKLAWRCSSIAPVAFLIAIGAIVLDWAAGARVTSVRAYLPAIALLLAVLGLAAHMIVHYHAIKAGTFPRGTNRSKLEISMRFNLGYGKWRTLMRAQHPELRSGSDRR